MRIFLKLLVLIIALVVFGYLFFYSAGVLLSPGNPQNTDKKVCFSLQIGEYCFLVEFAETDAERGRGLMFKEQLDKDGGVLFIFDSEDVYPFWMKNTLIPLDIIWIDKNQRVVFIKSEAQPCPPVRADIETNCSAINPQVSAQYVLEINAGMSETLGIKIGDTVEF